MSKTLQVEETTVREMAQTLFNKFPNAKLSRMGAEFILESHHEFHAPSGTDINTLKAFVEFLIKKGYN